MTVEDEVRDFYDERGWHAETSGQTADAELWEDLRPCAAAYVSACRRKVLTFLPSGGERLLDAGSGPIQYPEYLEYSAGFAKRVCVDLSQRALDEARAKLGERGDYVRASLLELPFPAGHFDAAVSLHTIYHIDRDRQDKAVRELVRVLKPESRAVVVYANPDRLVARLKRLARRSPNPAAAPIYFFAHPLSWWARFSDEAAVEIVPWRFLNANESRRLIPDNAIGAGMFRALLAFERAFPSAAAKLGCYPMIVLTKRARA